jgi:hypothetical protein
MTTSIVLGPVLSFRGVSDDGHWRVTALVGFTNPMGGPAAPPPGMDCNGKPCPLPVLLLTHGKDEYWRYDLTVPMAKREQQVPFALHGHDATWHFTVPARGQAPRMAYVSCNGFSDPSGMRKLVRPANAVWADLLANHDRGLRPPNYPLDKEQLWHEERVHQQGVQRFHLLLMGGDQIYFDSIWEDIPQLKEWVGMSRDAQLGFKVTKTLEQAIETYYLKLYSQRWLPNKRKPWGQGDAPCDAADAMARTPTVMMWDDHDIFDGWGSYSPAMQHCPLFDVLFTHARRAFWVFQMQHALADLPDLALHPQSANLQQDPQYQPIVWQHQLRHDPLALPLLDAQPGFSAAYRMGPVALLVADLRTERSRTQIWGRHTWAAAQTWLQNLSKSTPAYKNAPCKHLLCMSSVPVVHPKLSLVEGLLDTFGQDHVQDSNADDLKDHWSHDDHEGERKRLLETLARTAQTLSLQATILSGDVHVAAWGTVTSRHSTPEAYWAPIVQFTSSAVVHPSLTGVAERLFLWTLNKTAAKPQNLDAQYTVEMMLFPGHNQYIMPARNWLALELDTAAQPRPKLWATWRCEGEKGFSNHLQVL